MRILQLLSCRGWSSDAYWAARATQELTRRGHTVTLGCRAGTEVRVIERARTMGIERIAMFAFAVWDRAKRSLTVARDRLGEKPLYYGYQQKCFVFASELKALGALRGWTPNVPPAALPEKVARSRAVIVPTTVAR